MSRIKFNDVWSVRIMFPVICILDALGEQKELTISENDTVNCSVNCSSKSCTYSWKYDSGIINRTESYDPVIELKRPGRYICEAICLIKDINCTIAVMTVYVNINAVLRSKIIELIVIIVYHLPNTLLSSKILPVIVGCQNKRLFLMHL